MPYKECWKCGVELNEEDTVCPKCDYPVKRLEDSETVEDVEVPEIKLSEDDSEKAMLLRQIALLEKQGKSIDSIKRMLTFFVVLTVISLLGSLIAVINLFNLFS